jgi:hypothetical protein
MPASLTEITELATALGMLVPDLAAGISNRPLALQNVDDQTWARLVETFTVGEHRTRFETAFANGAAFLRAEDGLRERYPKLVEWKGPHRPPGDDVIPADIRVDHVYQVSCKYQSRVMQNAGPARLFDHALATERRSNVDWFHEVAPREYQSFYDTARASTDLLSLPALVTDLSRSERTELRDALRDRRLPDPMRDPWRQLSDAVARRSAERWTSELPTMNSRLRMLWRLLRIGDAPYFVLGANREGHLRLRVASAWDWVQANELVRLTVEPRPAGQPEVSWRAMTRNRVTGAETDVVGHIEVRWSHGRFSGNPEAKIYLDTPLDATPGYFPLR